MKKTVFTTLVVLMLTVLCVFAMPMAFAENEATDNIDATAAVLSFDEAAATGEIVEVNGVLYYQEGGKNTYKGLFLYTDGNYYYAKSNGALAVNTTVTCSKTACDLPTGSYRFDEQGRACNGIFDSNGTPRYYENGKGTQKGFFKLGDDYYYAKAKGYLVFDAKFAPPDTNCDLPANTNYYFDAEGKLYQGIYFVSGYYRYYENGKAAAAGLVKVGDDYYYAKGNGIIAIDEKVYATTTNCDLPANTNYLFDEEGKAYQGIRENANGALTYYENGKGKNIGLFLYTDGKYYFSAGSGLLIVDRTGYNAYKTSCDLPTGVYDFDATGAVIGYGANVETPECAHDYVATTTPATCAEAGKTVYTCSKCGDSYEEIIPATGNHDYVVEKEYKPGCNKEGAILYRCTVCGESYEETVPATGKHNYEPVTYPATCTQDGENVFTCVDCGDSYSVPIPATGHNYVDGACTDCGEKDPSAIEHDHSSVNDFVLDQNHFSVVIGTDVNEFIEKNVIGQTLTITYADGCVETVPVTWDMVREINYDFNEIGKKTYCSVNYMYEGGGCSMHVYATVIEDMGDAKLLGTYTVTDENYPWEKVELYDNGKLFADGQQSDYQLMDGGLIVYEYEGVLVVMVMDDKTMTMWGYVPSESDPIIGTYTMVDGPVTITVVVYGKYNGAGDYVAYMTQVYTNPNTGEKQEMSITTVVTLDLENSVLAMLGGEFIINEDNTLTAPGCNHSWTTETREPTCTESGYTRTYCTLCGAQNGDTYYTEALGHEDLDGNGACDRCGAGSTSDIESVRKSTMVEMRYAWDELTAKYGSLPEYADRYNALYHGVKEAKSEDEIAAHYNAFKEMEAEIRNAFSGQGCQHSYTTVTEMPTCENSGYSKTYCTLCGMVTSEVTLPQYGHDYVDGTCKRCGASDPSYNQPVMIASYPLAAGNTFGWTRVDLYDNGQLVTSNGNTYSYALDGALLTVWVDGVPMVMALQLDWYVPQNNVIGTYYYTPMLTIGMHVNYEITVYGDYCGAGDYFARVKQTIQLGYGMTSTMEMTTVVTLDLENRVFNSPMFSQQLNINGNTLSELQDLPPVEFCKHANVRYESQLATCRQSGYDRWICNDCGSITEEKIYDVRPCQYGDNGTCIWCGASGGNEGECYHYNTRFEWVQDATCTEQGIQRDVCVDCGVIVHEHYTEPYGHDMSPEKGYCYRCGYKCESFEELRSIMVEKLHTEWDNLARQYELNEEEWALFTAIDSAMNMAESNDVLSEQWNNFEQLRSDIYNSRNDNFQGSSLNPNFDDSQDIIEVTVGSSEEDFLKQFIGKTLYLKFTLTGVVEITITEDMIDADELDFSEVGEAWFQIRYEHQLADGVTHSGSYGVSICVAPDLSEATELGTYKIGGMDPNWEMTEITLYSNGWMKLVLEEGEYWCYVEYEMNGNVVSFDLMGEAIFIVELNEKDGTFYYYQPAADTLYGSYGYDGGTVELYTKDEAASEYYFLLVWPEEYTDGIRCWMTMPCTMNEAMTEIIVPTGQYSMIFLINDDGTLSEKECEHQYEITEQREATCTEGGSLRQTCIFCGSSRGTYSEPLGHNYDETGVCTRCGLVEGGFVDREDITGK